MTHYDVLGVGPSADRDELHAAYLRAARSHHPDRQGGDANRMQAVNQAWATLGDPARRAAYDQALRLRRTAAAPPAPGPRRGYEPDPRYDPTDDIDADLRADLADDRPLGPHVVLPRWMKMLPIGTFALSIPVAVVSTVLASEPGLALAFMLMLLSGVFFLAAPFMALLASHRRSDR